jgi:hypothetical protein
LAGNAASEVEAMRKIFIAALIILVGGGIWMVATQWSDAPTEDPAVRGRIATEDGAPASGSTPASPADNPSPR